MKKKIIVIIVIVLLVLAGYFIYKSFSSKKSTTETQKDNSYNTLEDGKEVELTDGSKWYVLQYSAYSEDDVTLISKESVKTINYTDAFNYVIADYNTLLQDSLDPITFNADGTTSETDYFHTEMLTLNDLEMYVHTDSQSLEVGADLSSGPDYLVKVDSLVYDIASDKYYMIKNAKLEEASGEEPVRVVVRMYKKYIK